MKVLLLSKYSRQGASSRLRSLQYLPALAEEGIEVTVRSLFDEQYLHALYTQGKRPRMRSLWLYLRRLLLLPSAIRYDLIWLEKELFPYLPATCERLLSWCGVRYVVDYDDAIFHHYDLAGNRLLRKVLGRKIDTVMARASCVIAGNDYLASRAQQAGASNVVVIPTVVDHSRYTPARRVAEQPRVIGWIGSPSTQRYVIAIQDALRAVCDRWDARLLLVGATDEVVEQLAGIPVDVVPWREETEADAIARMTVGIMPLVDGPWEKGKCGYKLIQYMASAVPVVASPVGVNVEIVRDSGCGRLAQTTAEWTAALQELLADSAVSDALGCAGREAVETHYSLQAQTPRLAGLLKSTIK